MSVDLEKMVREYIDKTVHLSLATVSGSKPWVCEVHFSHDNALNLYFVSLTTTRHCQEIANNPNVAGNIVKQHNLKESPHGVYFEGSAERVENPSAEEIGQYCSRLQRNKDELIAQLKEENGRRMYRISVKSWALFGDFETGKNQKHELAWGKK